MRLNHSRIREVSSIIREISPKREEYVGELFPSLDDDPTLQKSFFLAMVSIDHRTRSIYPYEAIINGKRYFGSELLYRKGMLIYEKDPNFFLPERLKDLPGDPLLDLLLKDPPLWDMHVRTLLLKDLGFKLHRKGMDYYLEKPKRLKEIRAYEDPVEKKIYLLIKFLEGRGLISYEGERHVAVDNHLTRLALMAGIVDYTPPSWEVSREEDISIRMAVREAWDRVAFLAGVDPFALDDYLWRLGREGECPFCIKEVREHVHLLTWYY